MKVVRRDAKSKTSTLATTTPAPVQTTLVVSLTQAMPHIEAIAGDAEEASSATVATTVATGAAASLMPAMGATDAAQRTVQARPAASAIAAPQAVRHKTARVGTSTPRIYRTAKNC